MATIPTLELRRPHREHTEELDLDEIAIDPTLEDARGGGADEVDAEAARALRRARSLHASGAMRAGVIGSSSARARFEACLAQAEQSPTHAAAAKWLRARVAREEQRLEDAIAELKRALHLTRDAAATRAIYTELAEIHASAGEHGEAHYYARRASSRPPPARPHQ